ncbi:MAG: 4-carboxymuconolactone decarboxylase [Candidatus Dormibacteraeota bacterium]|uniref:4-carboxymuconolactone decarboxylase n=1 Tax=Candidatus Dormiibacter inghamiae TaxID=3127013 RepID=A0A934N605_9BACT|nr:4-carboxymuconolactone decarboxylase [Candidatus Dormibacteraeota bacterium]MBJ7606983.1 4-carboxymuconolactone decarboxylase [Candidatus Dormibacteraeota bacterium]
MSDPSDYLELGREVRRAVLGSEYVDHSQATRTPLNADFQDLLTRYAWGEIWGRKGLDRRTRSCITVAMLVALNHPEELALHLRGTLRNGVSAAELREVLLQTAVYCGFPAARSAFRVAQEVLGEMADQPPGEEPQPDAGRGQRL